MTQALPLHSGEFTGGPRFELRRLLGEGGFGTVYQAFDREHGCIVALKHLRRVTADTLYLFKQEFRALNDLSHPNLVSLYELISDPGGHWLLVMEFIDGVDFLTYQATGPGFGPAERLSSGGESILSTAPHAPTLRPGEGATSFATLPRSRPAPGLEPTLGAAANDAGRTMPPSSGPLPTVAAPGEGPATPQPAGSLTPQGPLIQVKHVNSYAVLRDSLRQLAEGLCALHAADKLHRDIKPSNVTTERNRTPSVPQRFEVLAY